MHHHLDKPATIKDIAQRLGVSISTVSRILNGKNYSNKNLVAAVQDTAKSMNYRSNTYAAGLRTKRTKLLGVVVPDISDDFFASILSGMEKVVEEQGYNLLLAQSHDSEEREQGLIRSLLSCNVEGILISPARETQSTRFFQEEIYSAKPIVFFDRVFGDGAYPEVGFNDYDATHSAGLYLLTKGFQKFMYVGLSETLSNDRERLQGYEKAFSEHEGSWNGMIRVGEIANTQHCLEENWPAVLPQVILCYNDVIAAEVLLFCRRRGIKVPEQVSVLGFDNRKMCAFTYPQLSTIDHSSRDMGIKAISTMFSIIQNTSLPEIKLDSHMVIRESLI